MTRLDRLPGLVDLTVHGPGGAVISSGPAVVHICPVPETCPTPVEEVAGRG
ncbi:hypothetical protein WB388_40200 [Streptomyces brasiliscabiei]|uniref:Uncharacterized protein n=1 Tax=Streptomyces brasiliscabiei TaxID=2736302 RepID=A0ABU8GPX9_9ACTN